MNLEDRLAIYKKIEDYRKNPLIVYATSTRPGVNAMMASDAVRQLIDQLDAISDVTEVDVLIHSSGGDGLAAWKLMSVLRERFQKVNVLVPFMAFSAATIFSLGANKIIMHPHASLGPIDPQITVTRPDGARQFSYEDVGAFLRFLSDEVGVKDQAYITTLVDKIFSAVDPLSVGAAKRASELATTVGERLLRMHLSDPGSKDTARQIAESLNKSFFAHGDAVSRKRARELNLQIAPDDPALEKLIWDAYLAIESYMELRKPFDALQHYMAHPDAQAALQPKGALNLPSNVPPQVLDQIWNSAIQQSMANLNTVPLSVDFLLIHALVESPRVASEFSTSGKISATRIVGGDIQISVLAKEGGWRNCPINSSPEKK